MHYKVWVEIERIPDRGEPHNVEEPIDIFVGSLRDCRRVVLEISNRYVDAPTQTDWKERGIPPYSRRIDRPS
jgi:hypothetical protein